MELERRKSGSDDLTFPTTFLHSAPYSFPPASAAGESTPSAQPASTTTVYSSPPPSAVTPVSTPSPSIETIYTSSSQSNEAQISKPSSIPTSVATVSPSNPYTGSPSGWNSLDEKVKTGVAVCIAVGILAVILFSLWFCCCLRKKRNREPDQSRGLPLHTVNNGPLGRNVEQSTARGGDAPPPRYEEVIPAQHQRLAGGISHVRDDEVEGMIADGKTPLSEIPFEDVVVLDHTNSPAESSSSQTFSARHHAGLGDTTGHTNS